MPAPAGWSARTTVRGTTVAGASIGWTVSEDPVRTGPSMASFTWALCRNGSPSSTPFRRRSMIRLSVPLQHQGGTRSLASSGPIGTRSLLHSVHLVLSSLNTGRTAAPLPQLLDAIIAMQQHAAFTGLSGQFAVPRQQRPPLLTARRRISSSHVPCILGVCPSRAAITPERHHRQEPRLGGHGPHRTAAAVAQHLGINQLRRTMSSSWKPSPSAGVG